MIEVREYLDARGRSPFAEWFGRLDPPAAAKVAAALVRMEHGNLSNAKSLGRGVFEYRIHFGPGVRIYFGRDGERLIVLLGGGTKKRQLVDINEAHGLLEQYQSRKLRE